MARLAGNGIRGIDSAVSEGAVVYLYDQSTNPSTEIGRTTMDAGGLWEFNDVPAGTKYHLVAEWDDGGTTYRAESFGFIEIPGEPNVEFDYTFDFNLQ